MEKCIRRFWGEIRISPRTNPCLTVTKLASTIQSVLTWPLKRKVVPSQGLEKTCKMQPGDLVPTFRGLACLAGEVLDFDSTTLNGLYTVLVFYEVLKVIYRLIWFSCVQGDFLPVSTSFLRALASFKLTSFNLVAVSTDSVEAHRFLRARALFGDHFFCQGVRRYLSQGVQHPPGGGQDRGDLPQLWGGWPGPIWTWWPSEHCRCWTWPATRRCPPPSSWTRRASSWPPSPQLPRWPWLPSCTPPPSASLKVGGSAEEVLRVVAACKECDSSNAWSRLPRGTAAVGQTQVDQLLYTLSSRSSLLLFRTPVWPLTARLTWTSRSPRPRRRRRRRRRRRWRARWTRSSPTTPSAMSVPTKEMALCHEAHVLDQRPYLRLLWNIWNLKNTICQCNVVNNFFSGTELGRLHHHRLKDITLGCRSHPRWDAA